MNEKDIKKFTLDYSQKRPKYILLCKKMEALIGDMLTSQKIDFYHIESRAKSEKSFENKLKSGTYKNSEEIQDLAGIRIIGYVNTDISKIKEIIQNLFTIDEIGSVDKSKILGIDKVGYRSFHFICKLTPERVNLPEYRQFEGLQFEIQVRTILQHAWAEIEHDRNYKFSGVLPAALRRRFALLAGVLELADNEFDNISNEIEKYSKDVSEKTKYGDLDINIDTTSLRQYLISKFKEYSAVEPLFGPHDDASEVAIDELTTMGILTLKDLDLIFPKNYESVLEKIQPESNFLGVVRDILMIHNAEEYFSNAWKERWTSFSDSAQILEEFGVNVKKLSSKYNISLE